MEKVFEPRLTAAEGTALCRAVQKSFEEYAELNKNISKELVASVAAIEEPSKLADTVAAHFSFKIEDKQRLLEASIRPTGSRFC